MEFLIAGGAVVTHLAVWLLGYSRGRRLRPAKPEPLPNPLLCACTHSTSFHADGTGRCNSRSAADWAHGYTCRCMKFTSQDPVQLAAMKELEGE